MNKPQITKFERFAEITLARYERYLPTAFDESLTLLEKMNKLIEYLNRMGLLVNEVVENWNKVMEWVMNDGLSQAVNDKLDDMVADGTLDEIINEKIFNELNNRVETIEDDIKTKLTYTENDLYVTVGLNGDFERLNDALEYMSKHRILFKEENITGEVKLLSGFILREQVHVKGINMGWIDITSEDAEVIIDRQHITRTDSDGGYVSKSVFLGYQGAILPRIKTLFNYNNTGSSENIRTFSLRGSSSLYIHPYCGVIGGANRHIVVSQGSTVSARFAIIKNADEINLRVSGGGLFSGEYADLSGAGIVNVAIDSSTCNITQCDCSNAGFDGIRITAGIGTLSATGVDVSNSGRYGVHVLRGGMVNFYKGKANNCGTGIFIENGGQVNAPECEINNAENVGVSINGSGVLDAPGCSINDSNGYGLDLRQNAIVNIQNGKVMNSKMISVFIRENSIINMQGVDATGSTGANTVSASNISRVNAFYAKLQKTVGTDSNTDVRMRTGSVIEMTNATGGTYSNKNVYTHNGVYLDTNAAGE